MSGQEEKKNRTAAFGFDHPENLEQEFVDNMITTSRYKVYNFVFLNLKEQFRRKANIYFLIISILMMLGWYMPRLFQSSINPWGTVVTLVFVLGVTMVKDGIEDRNRHRADAVENRTLVRAIRKGEQILVEKRTLRVGDYVVVKNREQFPADLILMVSSDTRGQCFVETSNIDGETNLKIRKAPQLLIDSGINSEDSLPTEGTFECDPPNKSIHNFSAAITLRGGDLKVPVGTQNFLLRGSVLRNTSWIIGLVVYTGEDTKIMKNREKVPSKLSNIERTVNNLIGFVFLAQFALVVISVLVNIGYSNRYSYPYLGGNGDFILPYWLGNFFTFYILYSNFVPISLYVTVEMVNLIQAVFIEMDIDMYYAPEDVRAVCRNSTLCQELGQVEYIFSDKTGTLTQNLMMFKFASINGAIYDEKTSKEAVTSKNKGVLEFFRLLSVCHTVVPDQEGEPKEYCGLPCPPYEAESPDEGALVEAASRTGVRFFERTPDSVIVKEFDATAPNSRTYRVLATNEFNSTRKRMSVLVRTPEGKFVLYCKGADNIMFALCKTESKVLGTINNHLTKFAEEGLRTLVCAKREVSEADANAWLKRFKAAELKVENRATALEEVAADIEQGMTIVGASAIEDKLQEKVPETLEDLQMAGIKVWVLTGDKLETAVNIGYSCRLLNSSMRVVTIATETAEQARERLLRLEDVITISEDFGLLSRFRSRLSQMRSRVNRVFQTSKSPSNSGQSAVREPENGFADASQLASEIAAQARREKLQNQNRQRSNNMRISRSPSDESSGIMMQNLTALDRSPKTNGDIEEGFTSISFSQTPASLSSAAMTDSSELMLENSGAVNDQDQDPLPTDHLALVIDGHTLHFVMSDPRLRRAFLHIGRVCKAVIACRVSPAQKAEVVSLVKDGIKSKPITLAIGDGANDVTMIQQAHLGVGVSGREGRAAVNSSDFAIAQFRFLKKLLLVHGRSNYRRMCKVILVCFYKNIALVITLFIYSFWSLMSGISPYDSWVYAGYNWFSGMPPVLIGAFDFDMSPEFLLALPIMYVSGRKSMYLNKSEILKWIIRATVHALVCALIPIYIGRTLGLSNDLTPLYSFGTMMFTGVLLTVIMIIGLETKTFTGFHWFFYPGSIALFAVAVIALSSFTWYHSLYGVGLKTFSQAMLWALAVFFIPLTNYSVEVFLKYLRLQMRPNILDLGAEVDNGKSQMSPKEFAQLLQADYYPAKVPASDIDDVMESTYSAQEASETKAPRVARSVSSYILHASEK